MGRILWRATVITHRYLGVAVGLLMLMWFASGIVMMYVPYPSLTDKERLSILPPIPWQACCSFDAQGFEPNQPIRAVEIQAMAGEPLMGLFPVDRPPRLANLGPTGPTFEIDEAKARTIALGAAPAIIAGDSHSLTEDLIEVDQWTVGDASQGNGPFYRFSLDDPARTQIYVSSTSGEVLLWTTATQRFWNWFGAIPHWLYFTQLRSNGPLWSQIVIWTSIVGGFLTLLGLYLGIAQFRQGRGGRISPYRGWFYWHHIVGLVFGVLTLTWVVSGTISMNPWGFLEGRGGTERARLAGQPIAWSTVRDSLAAMKANPPEGVVRLRTAPLDSKLYWLAAKSDGSFTRLDANGTPAPLGMTGLQMAEERLVRGAPVESKEIITTGDDYYFDFSVAERDDAPPFPVYRVVLNDSEHTRYYLDPRTGQLLRRVDANGRGQRWLFNGLHRLDFTAWLRARPIWDVIMIVLLIGGLAVTGTGTYLALSRIKRDLTFKRQVQAEPVRET